MPLGKGIFMPHLVATKSGGLGGGPLRLDFERRSPFSNERQVTASATNGKLKRIKTHGRASELAEGEGGGGF